MSGMYGGSATTDKQVRVFVNYRRDDTRHVAGRLRDLVVARFGERSVFVDVESIEPGVDYVTAIDAAVGSCDVMLVLIGDRWLEPDGVAGARRIEDPGDRLRMEIEAGLRNMTRVIPVLVDSASMPKARDLPASLESLSRHQALRLRHETFRTDADYLLDIIDQVARTAPRPGRIGVPGGPSDTLTTTARWLAVGGLLAVLAVLATSRSEVRSFVVEAHPNLWPTEPWPSLVWLLPALPVVGAAWLHARGSKPGVALGCIVAAAVWVVLELAIGAWGPRVGPGVPGAYALVLVLLLGCAAATVVAAPAVRQPVRANAWDRALVAGIFVVAAILLRLEAKELAAGVAATQARDGGALANAPQVWISLLVPLVIGVPAAALACNRAQTQLLLTLAWLQIAYPVVIRAVTWSNAIEHDGTGYVFVNHLTYVAGSVCILVAVLIGQRKPHRVASPAADLRWVPPPG